MTEIGKGTGMRTGNQPAPVPLSPLTPFGILLREYREAAGLTQEQLAEQADMSAKAIGDIERGVTLKSHPYTVQRLSEALGLGPTESALLWEAALATRKLYYLARGKAVVNASEAALLEAVRQQDSDANSQQGYNQTQQEEIEQEFQKYQEQVQPSNLSSASMSQPQVQPQPRGQEQGQEHTQPIQHRGFGSDLASLVVAPLVARLATARWRALKALGMFAAFSVCVLLALLVFLLSLVIIPSNPTLAERNIPLAIVGGKAGLTLYPLPVTPQRWPYVEAGQAITAEYTIRNTDPTGTRIAQMNTIEATVRGPNACALGWGAPNNKVRQSSQPITLRPGEEFKYVQAFSLSVPGIYFVEPTLQRVDGSWGGIGPSPRIYFMVVSRETIETGRFPNPECMTSVPLPLSTPLGPPLVISTPSPLVTPALRP